MLVIPRHPFVVVRDLLVILRRPFVVVRHSFIILSVSEESTGARSFTSFRMTKCYVTHCWILVGGVTEKTMRYNIPMIYYVEDDTNIRDLTVYALRQAGFEASGFPCASEFFAACEKQTPEMVLLDIMLPEVGGLEILKTLRKDSSMKHLPVIMLTAKGTEYDTVCGLDAGADDYLAKPFGMMELVSRINALLRRIGEKSAAGDGDKLVCGDISMSTGTHTAYVGEVEVELTLKEFDLLYTLLRSAGQVFSRNQLLKEVWDMTYVGGTRTVDVHVQTLRQKLAAVLPGADSYIHTVRGVGYCMKLPQ